MNDTQKLIDIMIEVSLSIHNNSYFSGLSDDEVTSWIREQLSQCGYETEAIGASHAFLKK